MSATERFTGRAEAYVAGRPSYPEASIDLLFAELGDPRDVVAVDLGAGTGISARLLAARGAHVIAVEPNAAMREAAPVVERVRWLGASAEATGLETGSADLVAAFQAFHWFDHATTLAEIERIMRPGGRAAVVYNERDERDPFAAAYGAVVRTYATDATEARRVGAIDAFGAYARWARVQRVDLPSAQAMDRATMHARAASTSYLPHAGPEADALHAALDAAFDGHEAGGMVTLGLRTIVVTAERGAA